VHYAGAIGHKPSEKSVVLSVLEIIELAKKMVDEDVIYIYHIEKQLELLQKIKSNMTTVQKLVAKYGG
jgi:hypothetical protein